MLTLLPPFLLYALAAGLGAVVGSFLNVVIYRLHTGRSLSGRSHCLSCGKPLRWYELIPVLSYLFLRGRCAGCGSRFSPRYMLVELLTAVLFAGAAYAFLPDLFLIAVSGVLFAVLVVIVVYDYNHLIIPDSTVVLVSVVAVLLEGYRFMSTLDVDVVLLDIGAALAAGTFFWGLWFFSGGRWLGFGDVKLVVPLALIVGAPLTFSFVVLSFWIGALISLAILSGPSLLFVWDHLVQRASLLAAAKKKSSDPAQPPYSSAVVAKYPRYFTMKSEVPFGPFLVAGFSVTYLLGLDVLTVMFYAI